MDAKELKKVLDEHKKWLKGEGGNRADLSGAKLFGTDLSGADLSGADLSGANLSGADLFGADLSGTDLSGTDLSGTDLSGADLSGANLSGAKLFGTDLSGTDLSGANLSGAKLSGADLSGAKLSGADLCEVKGLLAWRCAPLKILMDQPGKIRAYKLVNKQYEGIYKGGFKYEIGAHLEVGDANTDPAKDCGAGINVADSTWICTEWKPKYKIMLVEFEAEDIACIPYAGGKFRLNRCDVVGEVDPADWGLVEKEGRADEESDSQD